MNKDNAISIAMDFIKQWEQLGLKSENGGHYTPLQASSLSPETLLYAYPDGKSYSIGWGTYNKFPSDGSKITANTIINKEKADSEFEDEVLYLIIPAIDNQITRDLNENEYAALVSFAYNAGPNALKYNGLIDAVNNGGDVVGILKRTALTDQQTGKISNGLVNRRKDEAALYSGERNALYSYYLRNASTINYAVIGVVLIGLSGYIYYLKRKKLF